jgi:DNA-binding transcriptional MerR regulator
VRPSRAKPKTGWTLAELAQLSGVTTRAIRVYLDRNLVPRPRFKGPATRYDRTQLLWLLAIRRLRVSERLGLQAIATRLRALSASDLEALAVAGLAPGADANAALSALGMVPAGAPSASIAIAATSVANGETSGTRWPKWARIELALGLELHLRDDASPRVLELARQLRELCAAPPTDR